MHKRHQVEDCQCVACRAVRGERPLPGKRYLVYVRAEDVTLLDELMRTSGKTRAAVIAAGVRLLAEKGGAA